MMRSILLFVCLLFIAEPADAQWSLVSTFPGDVHCIYFSPQAPQIGFVGLGNGKVYRTTNTGTSWTLVATVTGTTEINSFAFKDSLTGWLSCSLNNFPWPSIYRTTNGGSSWIAVPSVSGACSQVWYSKVTHKVTANLWYSNNMESADDGITWSTTGISGKNSTAWISDSVGVMSCTSLSPNFLYTKNGGVSWSSSALSAECFAPCGVTCTGTFFATTEFGGNVFRSLDSGATWSVVKANAFGTIPGCIVGNSTHLFQQTNTAVMMSVNQGTTWTNIGGPGAIYDHRSCLINGLIYVGDTSGHLYVDTNYRQAPEGTFTLNTSRIAMQGIPCTTRDSIFYPLSGGCVNITILQINKVGNSPHFVVTPTLSLPRPISSGVGVHVTYDGFVTDSDMVHLRYTNGTITTDTNIRIAGLAGPIQQLSLALRDTVITAVSCRDSMLSIPIVNAHCDTTWITTISLDDPVHFQITAPTLPFALRSGASLTLPVQTTSHRSGVFTAHVRLHYQNRYTGYDTSITIVYRVLTDRRIQLALRDTVVTGVACMDSTLVISITNPHCDSVSVSNLGLDDQTHFQVLSGLPAIIPSGGTIQIVVRTTSHRAGSFLGHLQVHYANSSIAGDTVVTLNYTVQSERKIALALQDTLVSPGACLDSLFNLRVSNLHCDSMWITNLGLDEIQHFTLGTSATSIPIAPGSSITIPVRVSSHRSGRFVAHLSFHFANGSMTGDTTITLYYTVQSEGRALVNANNIVIDNSCVRQDTSAYISNASCDPLTVSSVQVLGIPELTVTGLTFPIQIPPGGLLRVPLSINALYALQRSGNLQVKMSNAGGTYDTTMPLDLLVRSGDHLALSVNTISINNACTTQDSTLFLINPRCDTVVITRASISGIPELAFSGLVFPVSIPPGDTLRLRLTVHGTHPVSLTGSADLSMMIGSNAVDTSMPLHFNVKSDILPVALLSAPNIDFGSTSTCFAKDAKVVLSNALCEPLTITAAGLKGGSNFRMLGQQTWPIVLQPGSTDTLPIRFAPTAAGPSSDVIRVSLSANGSTRDTIIGLQGSGSSSIVADLDHTSLNFDTLVACDQSSLPFSLTNHYCGPLLVTSVFRLQGNNFIVTWSHALPYWLAPGDSLNGTVTFGAPSALDAMDSVMVAAHDSTGAQWQSTLLLTGHVVAPKASLQLSSSSITLDSLPGCSNLDTVLYVTNVSHCDASVDSVTINNLTGAIITIDPPAGSPLPVGARVAIHIHMHPMPGDHGDGWIQLSAGQTDTSIAFHYTTSSKVGPLASASVTSISYRTTQCGSGDSVITFRNEGCFAITADSVALKGSAKFAMASLPTMPVILQPGDSLTLHTTYDAGAMDPSTNAVLDVRFNGGALHKTVSFTSTIIPPALADVSLQAGPGELSAGHTQSILLKLDSNIQIGQALRSVQSVIHFEDRMMTFVGVKGMNGWQTTLRQPDATHIVITATALGIVAHPANEEVAELEFRYVVGDTLGGRVDLNSTSFNPQDLNYERCTLAATSSGSIDLTIMPQCGDSMLSAFTRTGLFKRLRIAPNPVGPGHGSTAELDLARKSLINFHLQNLTGSVVNDWSDELGSGQQTVSLPMDRLPSGVYYLTIHGESEAITRRLVVIR